MKEVKKRTIDSKSKSVSRVKTKKNGKVNKKLFDINLKKIFNKMIIIKILLLGLILFIIFFCFLYMSNKEQLEIEKAAKLELRRKENLVIDAKKYLSSLYEGNIPKYNIEESEYEIVLEKINLVEDDEIKKELTLEIFKLKEYTEVENLITKLLNNNNLIDNYSEDDVNILNMMFDYLDDSYKPLFQEKINIINQQRRDIDNAKKSVANLFKNDELKSVKTNVTRSQYNTAKSLINKLPQKEIKNEYNNYLKKVLVKVEQREKALAEAKRKAEEKAKREAQIKAAWVILETPYISQNKNKIYNGCEASSLLMGLKYKGYLRNTSLKTFVDAMPKSDDPHQGFVRDIYGFEPRDVPHWIAPDALAKFGRNYSGNSGVKDITGTSVAGLKKELDNKNPVVIYATGGNFDSPVDWVEEVPKNVHVMLLIGYNPISKQMVINDPWTKTSSGKVYISEDRFTTIYNKIGKKAVVIR